MVHPRGVGKGLGVQILYVMWGAEHEEGAKCNYDDDDDGARIGALARQGAVGRMILGVRGQTSFLGGLPWALDGGRGRDVHNAAVLDRTATGMVGLGGVLELGVCHVVLAMGREGWEDGSSPSKEGVLLP